MILHTAKAAPPEGSWRPWFAWYPVWTTRHLRWLEWVERKVTVRCDVAGAILEYRPLDLENYP